jgi:hypothetical protein
VDFLHIHAKNPDKNSIKIKTLLKTVVYRQFCMNTQKNLQAQQKEGRQAIAPPPDMKNCIPKDRKSSAI